MKEKNFLSDNRYGAIYLNEGIILLACLLIGFYSGTGLKSALFYFLYQFFGIFIPGLSLLTLIRKRSDLFDDAILYSYVFGTVFILIVYFAYMHLLSFMPSIILTVLLCVISLYNLYRNRDWIEAKIDVDHIVCFVIIAFLYVICFHAVSLHTISPERYGSTVFNKDFLFWVGNSISFTKGLPVQNFRLVGEAFYYHYFSNILIAFSSMNSGIDVFTVSYYYSYLIPCLLLVLSCFDFLKTVTGNRLLIYSGMIFILLISSSTVYLPEHLYYCPFGFDYGYAFSMLSIACLIRMYQKDVFSSINVFISCVLIAVNTGFKAPITLTILIAHGAVAFCFLLQKKWTRGMICGFVWLFSFLVIYFLVISGLNTGMERKNGLELLGILGAFDKNRWAIEILNELVYEKGFQDNGIARIVALFLYVFRSNRAAMLLLMISACGILYFLFRRNADVLIPISLIVMMLLMAA